MDTKKIHQLFSTMFFYILLIFLSSVYIYRKLAHPRQSKVHGKFEYIPVGLDSFKNLQNENELILIITGNPGIPEFYKHFAKELNSKFDKPVIIAGLGGHSLTNSWFLPLNLKQQVEYFKDLIKEAQKMNPDIKISVLGHSIGGYISLNLLKDFKFEKVYLLFPTLSHMAKSDNGKHLFYHFVIWTRYILNFVFFFSEFLPLFLLNPVISYLEVLEPSIHDLHKVIPQLLQYRLMNNVFYLLKHELDEVKEMDHELIEKNLKVLNFIYAKHDHWVPKDVPPLMKIKYDKNVIIEDHAKHAFVTHKKDTDNVLKHIKL